MTLGIIGIWLMAAVVVKEISPGADLCREINALQPGSELVLQSGDYRGPCTITRSGEPGAPIVVRAKDLAARPRIVYPGTADNVINLQGKGQHLLPSPLMGEGMGGGGSP